MRNESWCTVKRTDVVVIGGGQSGLAMSRCLSRRQVDHVVLERGRVAQGWRQRWPSLRLLTPNWQTRLPDFERPSDPDGFMTRDEWLAKLEAYAAAIAAPLYEGAQVWSVEARDGGFFVHSNRGAWVTRNVVVATGYCAEPHVPALAAALDPSVLQLTPNQYRGAEQLPPGRILVVGASATGVQLAHEISGSGRPVVLSVGRHARMPRSYRGRDIMLWLDASGILHDRADRVVNLEASRRSPSLQLVGSTPPRSLDLQTLRSSGVELVGHLVAVDGHRLRFASDLERSIAASDAKLERVLARIDRFIECSAFATEAAPAAPFSRMAVPPAASHLDCRRAGIRAVIWATGHRRSYPWLRLPVATAQGDISHRLGVSDVPGLYVIGMNFLRRRNSAYIDGVGTDARELSESIWRRLNARSVALQRSPAGF